MRSKTTRRFRKAFEHLPTAVRKRARKAYRLFATDPNHPSLQFKCVHEAEQVYSARISLSYRALAVRKDDDLIWFWVGNHDEYVRLIRSL